MGDWALHDGQRVVAGVLSAANSRYQQVASGGTADTKGIWLTIVSAAAVSYEATAIALAVRPTANALNHLIDIGIGGTGDAVDALVLENLLVCTNVAAGSWNIILPIHIPAGVRVAARHQCSTLSTNLVMGCQLLGGGFAAQQPLNRATTYGANTATSGGTSVDPGAVAHTKGAWVELEDVTPNPIKSLAVFVGGQKNAAIASGDFLIDVGVGAAAAEVVVLPDLALRTQAASSVIPTTFGPYPVSIPAGVRLAVRDQSVITDATDRLLDFVLVGMD